MATYSVNPAAVKKAKAMIDAHQYVLESDWSKAQPSTDQENDYIERNGYEAYGEWHLGLHDQQDNDQTKDRYGFCFGDFHRVHRQGLIAALDRAAEWHHDPIEHEARYLVEYLDSVHDQTKG